MILKDACFGKQEKPDDSILETLESFTPLHKCSDLINMKAKAVIFKAVSECSHPGS